MNKQKSYFEGENKRICEVCENFQEAESVLEIHTVPNLLVMAFQREKKSST